MWYIVEQNSSSISCIYLTSSKKKCKEEYDRLEKEVEESANDNERYTFYYMGYCKTGGK